MSNIPTDTGITSHLKYDLSYIKNHVVLLLITALLVFGAVYFVDGLLAKRAASEDAKWQQIVTEQHQQTVSIQNQLNLDETRWAQINAQLLASNQKLAETISSRNVQTQQQIKKDATLSAQEAADRISQIEDVSAFAEKDNIILPLPSGRKVVADLDLLPPTQADLANVKTQLSNETTIADNLQADADSKQKLIASLKDEMGKQNNACVAQVNDLKAQARKSKLKWFGIGWVAGLISGRLLGI